MTQIAPAQSILEKLWGTYRPWLLLGIGLVLTVAGVALAQMTFDPAPNYPDYLEPCAGGIEVHPFELPPNRRLHDREGVLSESWNPLRVALIGVGLLLAACAIQVRLSTAKWDLEARLGSAGVLVVAALIAMLAYLGMAQRWDSGKMLMTALIVVTVAGAILVALPPVPRKVLLSLWIVYHFGGILVSIMREDPLGKMPPWLPNKAWEYLYRPYQGFLYLGNAYHFYAPDPGPPDLIWFRIEYADESSRWVNLPVRTASTLPLQYTRMIAIGPSVAAPMPQREMTPARMQELRAKRWRAGIIKKIPPENEVDLSNQQYFEPSPMAKVYIASYVRKICNDYPHPDGEPDVAIKAVKAYRVIHQMLSPEQLRKI